MKRIILILLITSISASYTIFGADEALNNQIKEEPEDEYKQDLENGQWEDEDPILDLFEDEDSFDQSENENPEEQPEESESDSDDDKV